MGLGWFVGNAALFVKIGKNKSGMPPEFCLFVIDGEEMLLYLIGHREPWGDNSHRLGYGMCHFLRVLFWLENKFLGLF